MVFKQSKIFVTFPQTIILLSFGDMVSENRSQKDRQTETKSHRK